MKPLKKHSEQESPKYFFSLFILRCLLKGNESGLKKKEKNQRERPGKENESIESEKIDKNRKRGAENLTFLC